MSKIIISILAFFFVTNVHAAGNDVPLKKVLIDLGNKQSLQRGAQIYMNNCSGCHTLKYQRYIKFTDHLDLDSKTIEKNLIFTTDLSGERTKIGSLILNAVNETHSKEAFGVMPPDLTLTARSRGSDWIYTFLLSFYKDESRPFGANNKLYPNVNMPHVLWYMEGVKEPTDPSLTDFKYISSGSMSYDEYESSITDLVNFLTYVSEPAQLDRYRIGFWVILFLVVFSALAYLLKVEYWKDVK
tara:strand:- start:1288 stop:2013 length:726 start_codon:yes stop_codon:yes gene_type:complete